LEQLPPEFVPATVVMVPIPKLAQRKEKEGQRTQREDAH
jgi:hypothetical protein